MSHSETHIMSTESLTREKNGPIPLPATNGPRPHRCEICQRSFREVATLRKHEQLHRADRPCFTQSNDLRRHERNVHMRGKLYSYKNPATGRAVPTQPANPTQMNLAAYQAFALQQRAFLQHALTYESLMQNGVAMTTAQYLQSSGQSLTSLPRMSDPDITTSMMKSHGDQHNDDSQHRNGSERALKLEQVTPPPSDGRYERAENSANGQHSPSQTGYSPTSNKTLSPPTLPTTTSLFNTLSHHNGAQLGSPVKDENRPYSHESHSAIEYPRYISYPDQHALARSYHSAFSSMTNNNNNSDCVMDLRVNKSMSSVESEDGELDWKHRNSTSKTPDSGSETESKRDVTTTSLTPTVDSGVHHCPHCNIVFHDFTMYNLHQSLHSPVESDPFMCPSCMKHCQDRIEFMFHIVWHVKYPHTIPKYQSFKESYLVVPEVEENNDDAERL
ncbi:hypothetical protein MAR_030890 [Mya arenaria]|uniref:C2H2-type domain-containing protein n=1 Tax=Mya arenaria TaxID=6604 RepID=A0ABY7F651_MYAAR|nr:hypothetical protein MAR_030890 [Mya arenaria]